MEPLELRQIEALRKTPEIKTFLLYLNMNDFFLDLSTKGGRKIEMKRLARIVNGANRRLY